VHARDGAIFREAGLDPHEHGVPPAVHVEDLLAREGDLHGSPRELGELAGGDLVGEGIELAAEPAAHRRGHHADVRLGHVEDLAEEAVDVVWGLRRRPEGKLAVGAPVRHRRVLLHGQVGIALKEEDVFAHEVRGGEGRLHVAELERHRLVDIGAVAVLMDPHVGMSKRLLDRHEGLEGLVLHLDQPRRALCRLLVDRGYRGHRVAHHPHLLDAQGFFVLRHGEDAELDPRQIVTGDDGVDPGHGPGPRCVDALDPGVRVRTPQELCVGHPRQDHIVGETRFPRDLGPRIDLGQRLADNGELAGRHSRPPFMRSAANSTASRIFV